MTPPSPVETGGRPASTTYPSAPWRMHGRAFVQPYLVDAAGLHLPTDFEPIVLAGHTIGALGLIEYVLPSPLTYSELVWMPCLVHVTVDAHRTCGFFVEKMFVDSGASLAGGREIWALPKRRASFEIGQGKASIETDEGARLVLEMVRRGPALRLPLAIGTLQNAEAEVVRFRGSGTGRIASARMTAREERGLDGWMGWTGARPIHGLGFSLSDFDLAMHEPKHLRRPRRPFSGPT